MIRKYRTVHSPTDAASAAAGSVTIPADHVDALKDAADHWHQAAEDLIAASNLLRSTIAAAESAEAGGERIAVAPPPKDRVSISEEDARACARLAGQAAHDALKTAMPEDWAEPKQVAKSAEYTSLKQRLTSAIESIKEKANE